MRTRIVFASVLACAVCVQGSGAGPARSPDRGESAPLVWFAPLPRDTVVGRALGFDGSKDFMALFNRTAPWPSAGQRVTVFKLYGGWAANEVPLAQLEHIVADLDRRGIALAVEDGALQSRNGCGHGVEGFTPRDQPTRVASRIKAAGGTLRYVALDSTFRFGSLYDGPNACGFTAEEAARQFAAYVAEARRVFPNVVVGDIEALPPGVDPARLVEWMDVYRRITGTPLAFFHLDMGYRRLDWPEAARYLEDAAAERGIPFGIIYDGEGTQRDGGGGSDADWTATSEGRFVTFEAQYGGHPDHAVLQSWVDHPDYVLPESEPGTFTWLANRYLRPRTALTISVVRRGVTGRLIDVHGRPVGRALVRLGATPLEGPGIPGEYSISGTVPPGASAATAGFRVNTECSCSGASDFDVYTVRYTEGQNSGNGVPDPGFAQGLDRWSARGDAVIELQQSDRGAGAMLHVRAEADQVATLDSDTFPVAPGSRFRLTVSARVAPLSRGSGYFGIVFVGPSGEIARRMVALAPQAVPLGAVMTGHAGTFRATLGNLPAESVRLEARYEGDGGRFPAFAGVAIRR